VVLSHKKEDAIFHPRNSFHPCNPEKQTLSVGKTDIWAGISSYLTGSLWCRRSQQSFNMSTRFYFSSLSLHVSAPTDHPQVRYTIRCFNGLFLIQQIRCTYATRCRDVTCCTSAPRLCIPNTCYHMDTNIKVVDIKFFIPTWIMIATYHPN
jgi:hypothetical protein